MFKAQAELEASDAAALAENEGSSSRNKTEAIAAAVAAREKRGAARDDKLELKDLKAAVKFHPHDARLDGLFEFNTKGLCLQFLATVSPAWSTLLPAVIKPEATAPPLPAAEPAPAAPSNLLSPPPATTPRFVLDVLIEPGRTTLQLADADSEDEL